MPFSSLVHLLDHHATHRPGAPAILAPGRRALTYRALHEHVRGCGRTLRAAGIGRRDRVAVVMANGADMAVATLATAAYAVCAPVNPAFGPEELDRYFTSLQVRALITQAGLDSPARQAARTRGVPVFELSPAPDGPAGLFTLPGSQAEPREDTPDPSDPALLFLTSGTTSQPKVVRLTHLNICTAAAVTGAALALQPTDRCINVMPLFHGHGLIGVVLSSLAAGASVVCTPGCDADCFAAWLAEFRPTWYSAVPTMHQAILAAMGRHGAGSAPASLRFVRSASAPLPSRIAAELESAFGTCVIDTYAMMEASSAPVACQPLPPGQRKPGSVGVPAGLDVAIMDQAGALLRPGGTGEIVVRGATVMDGYDGDAAATQSAFAGGWFRTGDLGFFDDDGYLFLTGRAKEIINRGGEKIAPREIDDVLLEHAAVAEAVAFPVPHSTLGEDVAAAVVLRDGVAATAQDLRQFMAGRLSDFKIPRQILIVSEIPRGPTGKLQRIGIAAKLGLEGSTGPRPGFAAPRTPLETALCKSWGEILRVGQVGIHDSFFACGGDSLSAIRACVDIYELTRQEFEVSQLFEAPTIAEIARLLEATAKAPQAPRFASTIPRVPKGNGVAASTVQQQLWQLQHLLPGLPFFNLLYPLRLTSAFDASVLEMCVNQIVQRHEILRTTFGIAGSRCVQHIAPQAAVPLHFDDLHGLPEAEASATGYEIIQGELLHPFDLEHGPLLRVRLVRLDEREHLLLISTHQLVADGWSFGVLVDELLALYDAFAAGDKSPLAPLPIQYADFAAWQLDWQSHPDMVAQLAYWQKQLPDARPALEIAPAGSRETADGLLTAKRQRVLPASLCERAKRFSHQDGGTLFAVLVAALNALLHRYTGQDDVRVATVVANRNRSGTERLIGPLANTLILRTDMGGDPSPREVLRRVRATLSGAFARQDLPFEELVEVLGRERGIKASTLARVMILMQNSSLRPISSGTRLALEEAYPSLLLPLVTATTFNVTLVAHECADGLTITCIYKPSVLDQDGVDCLLADLQSTLERIIVDPERRISEVCVPPNQGMRALMSV